MNKMQWTGLSILAAAAALAAVPGATALSTEVHAEVATAVIGNVVGGGAGLWVLDCAIGFEHTTGDLAAIEAEQITHEDLLDATSYVSDTGWFAGNEVGAAGALIDCATL